MILKVNNLSFSYSSAPVLDGITFEAPEGKCTAVLGTNGAGKSTLLKCICRILRYSSGKIYASSNEVSSISRNELAKTVSYVPQHIGFTNCTVFDAVLNGRIPYKTKDDLIIVEKALEKLGLGSVALRDVSELSGGEKQKVAVARSLAQEASIMLFDEPTSNLDIKSRLEVINLLRSIAEEEKRTVIVTMHDINLALRFSDAFILMKSGKVYASGDKSIITADTLREVYDIESDVMIYDDKTIIIPK